MTAYAVGELARLAGVTVRTLRHYHDIGLLKPVFVGANGYRSYGEEQLLRLQQVLIHRELGIPLGEIAAILDAPGQAAAPADGGRGKPLPPACQDDRPHDRQTRRRSRDETCRTVKGLFRKADGT
ncbi:MerR family transcriptional regulator [Aminobacter sp. SR38]|jgi:DNA-binding transcriptional MerR regulator|uniref:MerR family transcriptional regulator n=1 Tax=Aminobacter sp. SR38 TaxID=2774562 RepID=UPI00177B9ECC|nr:MerR family transcriptional regulator [Aminobacter sp. SR38]QOF70500.1 MerR family transcriptional regulator [Aminobacter sp. SR38]